MTSPAWPKSGCIASTMVRSTATTNDIARPGGPPMSVEAAISQPAKIAKAGFRNSDGCTETTLSEYQRIAPLPKSVPNTGRSASATTDSPKATTPQRRSLSGDIIETASSTASATTAKAACRQT